MSFRATIKPNIIGKPKSDLPHLLSLNSGPYHVAEFDNFADLIQYAYIEGRAYVHSVVDVERHAADGDAAHSKTPRAYAYFQYSELLTVDIDKPTTADMTLEMMLSQSWSQYISAIYPSSSYTEEHPRWHIVFWLDQEITDRSEYMALAEALDGQIDFTTDAALHSAVQISYGTRFKDERYRHQPLTLTYVNELARLPVSWLQALPDYRKPEPVKDLTDREQQVQAHASGKTAEGSARVARHFEQSPERREAIVIEALKSILPTFDENTSREMWNQVWMSAHHGSPTQAVRNQLLKISEVMRPDGHEGREKWLYEWDKHTYREDGYTVASLFWLARQRGRWLETTAYEIQSPETINVDRITDWTQTQEEIPTRVALQAQTGAGKTRNLIYLYERLGGPRTVVFVPTMKLAMELVSTLTAEGMPATLYYDPETMRPKPTMELMSAQVLVTTLQTFALKIYKNLPNVMQQYGLVYVEESDQLISQFARARNTINMSHVRDNEARLGFDVLRDAMQQSGVVWCVDATMTQITVRLMTQYASNVRIIRNINTRQKAPVLMLKEKYDAYQVALDAVMQRKRAVVCTDTKEAARELYMVFEALGVFRKRKALLITKDTERDPAVQAFMENVDKQAAAYDLVVYNSVMASGVSIAEVKADVVVQIATYLTPRNNLQILNRYRKQGEVYVFYRHSENLYRQTEQEIHDAVENRVIVEADHVGTPVVQRTESADLRNTLALWSLADEATQQRAPRTFYMHLLRRDGRLVRDVMVEIVPEDRLVETAKAIRERLGELRDEVRRNWRTVRPIGPDMPPDTNMTDEQIIYGMAHYDIMKAVKGNVPEDTGDDDHIYDVCHRFKQYAGPLTVFADQNNALRLAEAYLGDSGRAFITIHNNITMVTVLSILTVLWGQDLYDVLTSDQVEARANKFLVLLDKHKADYDAVVTVDNDKYSAVLHKYDDVIERCMVFSRILLRKIGLKQSAKQGVYTISNLNDAYSFLEWRKQEVDFTGETVNHEADARKEAILMYERMGQADKNLVDARWDGLYTTFVNAVKSVVDDTDWS